MTLQSDEQISEIPIRSNHTAPMGVESFDSYFLTGSVLSQHHYQDAMEAVQTMLVEKFSMLDQPYSGKAITQLKAELRIHSDFTASTPLADVIEQLGEQVVGYLVNVNHPRCIAHLHCPPLIASIAAEVVIATTNQSMDSWDQSGAATLVEQEVINWFCRLYKLGEQADGIFTSGGTQSNFMGLLLARDYAAQHHFNWSIPARGLPPEAHKFRILCCKDSHFSILQAARLLGLGDQAVVALPLDKHHHLIADTVRQGFHALTEKGLLPIALVTTAGTTDLGIISPLQALANCSKELGMWFHVDAAVGGALMFSEQHRHQLAGIEQIDSLTIDFHKLFYQSISCSLFLLRDRAHFDLMKLNADYLNPESNAENGLPDLVTKSIQTTRRFDALKVYVTLQTYGQTVLGNIIDRVIDLGRETAQLIDSAPDFELANPPSINTVVFRYHPPTIPVEQDEDLWCDTVNDQIRLTLLETGEAVIGFTKFKGRSYLKLTLMNPMTRLSDIEWLLTKIRSI